MSAPRGIMPRELRKCGRCEEPKPSAEFAWRRKQRGQRDNYCRPCRAAYGREHYEANRQRYIDMAHARRQATVLRRAVLLVEFFRAHPCVDCGEVDPVVLEFDHVNEKAFNISKGVRDRSWEQVLREMSKCDVVCANCHRRRTARRGGFARAAVAQR